MSFDVAVELSAIGSSKEEEQEEDTENKKGAHAPFSFYLHLDSIKSNHVYWGLSNLSRPWEWRSQVVDEDHRIKSLLWAVTSFESIDFTIWVIHKE